MSYYNRNRKELNLENHEREYLNHGNCANVFRYGNIILKEYYPGTSYFFRLKPKVFDILKNINNRHFIELFDIYKDMDSLDLFIYRIKKSSFITDAYTAKYYPEDPINILYEPTDYILDNFRELEILFKIFTNNKILTSDVKRDNTIMTNDNIIIIDPDLFFHSSDPQYYISLKNKISILNLLKSIFTDNIYKANMNSSNFLLAANYLNDLINIKITEETDITFEISKKLKRFKKPIDYFIK